MSTKISVSFDNLKKKLKFFQNKKLKVSEEHTYLNSNKTAPTKPCENLKYTILPATLPKSDPRRMATIVESGTQLTVEKSIALQSHEKTAVTSNLIIDVSGTCFIQEHQSLSHSQFSQNIQSTRTPSAHMTPVTPDPHMSLSSAVPSFIPTHVNDCHSNFSGNDVKLTSDAHSQSVNNKVPITPVNITSKSANSSDGRCPSVYTLNKASKDIIKNQQTNKPVICLSPCSSSTPNETICLMDDMSVERRMMLHGYQPLKEIAHTLQGSVWKANDIRLNISGTNANQNVVNQGFGKCVIIKITSKDLYLREITILPDGTEKHIQEDIKKEARILQFLSLQSLIIENMDNDHYGSHSKSGQYFTHFIEFFEDEMNYFLVQEYGGTDLFEFVVECHKLIEKGLLSRKEWRLTVKVMMKQICSLLNWLHNDLHCCHLDISLENMLINYDDGNEPRFIKRHSTSRNSTKVYYTINKKFKINFCDFGLAEIFINNTKDINACAFQCRKYVGKTRYKAPKVYAKCEKFDARKADIWSLGITLFMMIIGAPPYNYPDPRDREFKYIMKGKILPLITSWKRAQMMTPQILSVLEGMLEINEESRVTVGRIMQYSWFENSTDHMNINTNK